MARERRVPLGYIAARRVRAIEDHGREGHDALNRALGPLEDPGFPRLMDRDPDAALTRIRGLVEAARDARYRFSQIALLATDALGGRPAEDD